MDTVSFALLTAIATRIPGITLANALGLIEDMARFPVTPVTLGGLADGMAHKFDPDRKILAIKELRAAAKDAGLPYGLKECKDECDRIYRERGWSQTYLSDTRAGY